MVEGDQTSKIVKTSILPSRVAKLLVLRKIDIFFKMVVYLSKRRVNLKFLYFLFWD